MNQTAASAGGGGGRGPGGGGEGRTGETEGWPCPRCNSTHTRFCYYNVSKPIHYCHRCFNYWTRGAVGGSKRKASPVFRSKRPSHSHHAAAPAGPVVPLSVSAPAPQPQQYEPSVPAALSAVDPDRDLGGTSLLAPPLPNGAHFGTAGTAHAHVPALPPLPVLLPPPQPGPYRWVIDLGDGTFVSLLPPPTPLGDDGADSMFGGAGAGTAAVPQPAPVVSEALAKGPI